MGIVELAAWVGEFGKKAKEWSRLESSNILKGALLVGSIVETLAGEASTWV